MAGRIASASIRAVVGSKRPIKAALTLVCVLLKSHSSENCNTKFILITTSYYVL